MYVGLSRMIKCTWTGLENITKLDWYSVSPEGLGRGIKLSEHTTALNLGPIKDISWNGRRFMCKATTVCGGTVEKNIDLWVKGHNLKLILDNNIYIVLGMWYYFSSYTF